MGKTILVPDFLAMAKNYAIIAQLKMGLQFCLESLNNSETSVLPASPSASTLLVLMSSWRSTKLHQIPVLAELQQCPIPAELRYTPLT